MDWFDISNEQMLEAVREDRPDWDIKEVISFKLLKHKYGYYLYNVTISIEDKNKEIIHQIIYPKDTSFNIIHYQQHYRF